MTTEGRGVITGEVGGTGRLGRHRSRGLAAVRAGVLALAVSGAAAGCATAQAAGDRAGRSSASDYVWRGTVPAGGMLEIKGVNGNIVAQGAPGSEVVVTATLRGRRSDPSQVTIERIEHAGGVTFCAVYPTPAGERENSCAPGDGGRMNTRRNDVEVEFRVQMPSHVPLRARTVNGAVRASGLGADVDATTVNGSIEVATLGAANARTVNGSIDARMQRLNSDVAFETVNGRITVSLPEGADADVEARWLNGGLESDRPIAMMGRLGRGRATGTIGRGGPRLSLTTVNGSIRIR